MTEEQIQKIIQENGYYTSYGDGPEWVVYDGVVDLIREVRKLQQQNKQLIEALEEIKDEEWRLAGEFTTIYTTAYYALQQIQGKET